jgi:alpha-amylase
MREAMFDVSRPGRNLMNTDCKIYKEIAQIAQIAQSSEQLKFGRMYFRQISANGIDFGFPYGSDYTLAFSRLLYPGEVLVAYNITDHARSDRVIVDASIHKPGDRLTCLYGGLPMVTVQQSPKGTRYVQLDLSARQFAIFE